MSELKHTCTGCGALRTKAEGCTTFTVCDECWNKYYAAAGRRRCGVIVDADRVNKVLRRWACADEYDPHSRMLPERRLWLAVIEQAVTDAGYIPLPPRGALRAPKKSAEMVAVRMNRKRSAMAWITGRDFATVCEMAGLNAREARRECMKVGTEVDVDPAMFAGESQLSVMEE